MVDTDRSITMDTVCTPRPPHLRGRDIAGYPHIFKAFREDINSPSETYSRSLLLEGHGFPLFCPQGNLSSSGYYAKQGVAIGDVGCVEPASGSFLFFFNIFLPKEHDYQSAAPEGFTPFGPVPDSTQRCHIRDYHKPGTVITSPGVDVTIVSESPLHVSYSSCAPEGGILVLPEGGSREDLIDPSILNDYIKHNAVNWYQHINRRFKYYTNGTLIVVTGCDKAIDWGVAAFPMRRTLNRIEGDYIWKPHLNYQLNATEVLWKHRHLAHAAENTPPSGLSITEDEKETAPLNQCVFIRGTSISFSSREWTDMFPPGNPGGPYYTLIRNNPSTLWQTIDSWKTRLHLQEEEQELRSMMQIKFTQILFQPLFAISESLLKMFPDANLVLVNDSVWCGLAKPGLCTASEVNDLITKVFETHTILLADGTITLTPASANAAQVRKKARKGNWALYRNLSELGYMRHMY